MKQWFKNFQMTVLCFNIVKKKKRYYFAPTFKVHVISNDICKHISPSLELHNYTGILTNRSKTSVEIISTECTIANYCK